MVHVKRFHCPIGVFFISLQALTEVLFSFAVPPFGCYCSGNGKLFCTRFTCAFVISLTLHGGGEGSNGWCRSWALLGGSSGVLGRLLLKVGVWLFNSTHFLCRVECLVSGVQECKNDVFLALQGSGQSGWIPRFVFAVFSTAVSGYHGIVLQATTATAVVVEQRQNITSKDLQRSTPHCPKTLDTPPSQMASHKSIYER